MPTQDLVLDISAGVARIELAEPDRGSPINTGTIEQLAQAVTAARLADARVVVLRSRGSMFCVGGDIAEFATAEQPDLYIDHLAESLHRVISELHRMDAIVVAAVQGTAAGAGFPLAAAADLVIAGENAKFTLAYTRIGLTPDGGSSLLSATLGLHRMLALALLNGVLTAAEARDLGLVTSVHPDGEFDAALDAVVNSLTSGSRTAQVAAKRLIRHQATPAEETALRLETLSIRSAAASPDGREGVAAFVEKRRPRFGG